MYLFCFSHSGLLLIVDSSTKRPPETGFRASMRSAFLCVCPRAHGHASTHSVRGDTAATDLRNRAALLSHVHTSSSKPFDAPIVQRPPVATPWVNVQLRRWRTRHLQSAIVWEATIENRSCFIVLSLRKEGGRVSHGDVEVRRVRRQPPRIDEERKVGPAAELVGSVDERVRAPRWRCGARRCEVSGEVAASAETDEANAHALSESSGFPTASWRTSPIERCASISGAAPKGSHSRAGT